MTDPLPPEPLPSERIAIVEGDREAAEMLHTFFRIMDLEASLIDPGEDAVSSVRRVRAAVAVVDLDLPDLRALEIAAALRAGNPPVRVVFCTDRNPPPRGAVAKPRDSYERALALLERVLDA